MTGVAARGVERVVDALCWTRMQYRAGMRLVRSSCLGQEAGMGALLRSLHPLMLGLAVVAGVLALLLTMLSTPRFLVVFVATVAAGLVAAGSAVHFVRIRSPLMFAALLPGLLGVYALADVFVRLLGGVRLLDLFD
jgi:hypothetical protein